jgi:LysR family transcriptional regulator, glycine cleavage system transcriptional activator
MSYGLPPLNGLRAFEASARHLSFKRAADELRVTPGAVSQQVKALEASIGVKLFRRLPRGLLLTAAGEDYLPSISRAFRAISEATENVAPALKGRRLRLAVSPTLRNEHPAIARLKGHQLVATIVFTEDLSQLLDGKVDAFLRASLQAPPGLHVDHIDLRSGSESSLPIALVILPGFAGCREHRALVKLLKSA